MSANHRLPSLVRAGVWHVIGALTLSGCVSAPPHPIDAHATALQLEAIRLDDARVGEGLRAAGKALPIPAGTWDLDSMSLVAWSLRPELAQSRAMRDAAAAGLQSTRERPNPLISLSSEFVRNAATGTSPWTIAMAFSWLLENPAQRSARIDQASARARTAVWQESRMVWQVRSEVRRAWLALSLAQLAQAQVQQEAALRKQYLELADMRVTAGAWPRPELERARVAALQSDLEAQQRSNEVLLARGGLAAALGVSPAALASMQPAVPALDELAGLELDWNRFHDAAVINRLDLAEALSGYDEADAAWREQLTRRYPGLTLGPGYSYDRGDHKLLMGVGAELPVFTRYDAAITAAAARREAAAQRFIGLQAQAFARLEEARSTVTGAREALVLTTGIQVAQDRAVDAARQRWQAGIVDRSVWLTAALERATVERARLAALTRLLAAFDMLEDTVQQPVWPASELAEKRMARAQGEGVVK
ncbi:MAG: TolC family protein [Steroidobacteraceae bacterium]